eukprot:3518820-Amphidinium_carterae.1
MNQFTTNSSVTQTSWQAVNDLMRVTIRSSRKSRQERTQVTSTSSTKELPSKWRKASLEMTCTPSGRCGPPLQPIVLPVQWVAFLCLTNHHTIQRDIT